VQVANLTNEIERTEQQTNLHRHEQGKAIKSRDLKLKQLRQLRQEKDDHKHAHQLLSSHAENLKSQISILQKEIVLRDKDRDQILAENEGVVARQKDENTKHDKLKTEINAVAEFRDVLGREIGSYTKSNAMQRAEVARLESDRKELAQNASDAMARYQQTVEEGKICQMRIDDLQKQIGDAQKRLEEQKKTYETVRNERNTHSKNLIEAQDEIAEMKQKHKILEHQLDQLKEELSAKEKQYHEAVSSHKTLNEKLDKMNKEKSYYNEQRKTYATQNKRLRQEITQLSKVIEGCDQRLAEQQTRFLTVTNERDILGTQLIRRNDELALLYEKIRIQQSTLNRGEVAYRDRLTDIRMLNLKISELKRNVHMAQVRIRVVDDLKQHVTSLTRQLALERTKVQALSEELENPQNPDRWRALGGEDLRADDKVQRIQLLQRRLIAITEQCVDRDATIQEKDKLFVELKAILARQPGPEVAEQLNVYQQDLRKKNTQLKSMASELNMLSSQQAEHRYEVERLNRELQDLKRKYYEAKMENQKLLVERNPGNAASIGGGSAA
jgi:chromosome segregation ATPase